MVLDAADSYLSSGTIQCNEEYERTIILWKHLPSISIIYHVSSIIAGTILEHIRQVKVKVSKMSKLLTIFTPTYNRAYCLSKCYESLLQQTSKDFLWMIIDDGSTDHTGELVQEWKEKTKEFEILYIYQENGGMHTAHNTAYRMITTELNVCIDSDDSMPEDAVDNIQRLWKDKKADEYSGIVALDVNSEGTVIGKSLPEEESIRLCDYYNHGGRGDKKLIYRTDVIRRYPEYPVFEGEKFVPLGYKYLLVDQDYRLLILNKPVCIVEYLPDGSTRNIYKQYMNNPKGFAFERKIYMSNDVGALLKFRKCIHYVANSLMAKDRHFLRSSPKKRMTVCAFPFGVALYWFTIYKAGTKSYGTKGMLTRKGN